MLTAITLPAVVLGAFSDFNLLSSMRHQKLHLTQDLQTCNHMCAGMPAGMCGVGMSAGMCVGLYAGMRVGMCVDMRVDMSVDEQSFLTHSAG